MGDAQSTNRSVERFEGDRYLRLQHSHNVGRQWPNLPASSDGANERVFRHHQYQRVCVRRNHSTARVRTEGRGRKGYYNMIIIFQIKSEQYYVLQEKNLKLLKLKKKKVL